MTLRQALARKWQVPLFIFSLVFFGVALMMLVPEKKEPTFDDHLAELSEVAAADRYVEFYPAANALRREAEDMTQVARVHLLAARTRTREIRQLQQLGVDPELRRTARANYTTIIRDYTTAVRYGVPEPESPEHVEIFHDIALAHWCLDDSEKAISHLEYAIELSEEFVPELCRTLVRMYLLARPKGYLELAAPRLERLLTDAASSEDDRAWAFVRKAEVMIGRGDEAEALAMLNAADEAMNESQYGLELELMRGRALRRAGQVDEADVVLRDLLERTIDPDDIYAQTLLELGKINLEQYRDNDARTFYERVIASQVGKDWYAAAKMGLAECLALQHRYDEAAVLYQETVELLNRRPMNRAIRRGDLQQSLAVLAHHLALLKQYALSLQFLEIEQQVAEADNVEAANRFARMHVRMAEQLRKQIERSGVDSRDQEPSEKEGVWLEQQRELKGAHYERAAEQFVKVASLIVGDDALYGDSLWLAAECYDKAGNSDDAIDMWGRFVLERRGMSRWPFALFNLAQAYEAVGRYDEAVATYEELRKRNPKSPASFDAMVPLARCYLAKEPVDEKKAEQLLLDVLTDPALTPLATHFREAIFELGELYYDRGEYPLAINRLTEAIDRYPEHAKIGKMLFLVGDSYRKSGLALDVSLEKLASDPTASVSREKMTVLRADYLEDAGDYFQRAIDFYSRIVPGRRTELDDMYLRHSWLYQADCLFDLGLYAEASLAYEKTITRYQLTPTALTAFLQIVNCQLELGNPAEAKSANRRALVQLEKVSEEALASGPVFQTRDQWRDWFEWTHNAGVW